MTLSLFKQRLMTVGSKSAICLSIMLGIQSCSLTPNQGSHFGVNDEFIQAKQLIAYGNADEGIKKLRQLTQQYPLNAEYRNTLKLQDDLKLAELVQSAESLLKQNKTTEAEAIYREVLALDAKNQRALNGLKKVSIAQKHQSLLNTAKQAMAEDDVDTARALIRVVLAEDASDEEARQLFEQLDEEAIKQFHATPKIKTAFKTPVSLEFSNTPIKSVFDYIGRAGDINFSFDRELSDSMLTSITLRDTPISDAIDTILTTNQLGKKIINANTLLIYPLSRKQEYEELYVRSFYLNNMDAKQAMALIKTVLRVEDVYIDETLNTLVMRDDLASIKTAEKLIASQDLVEPEVMLEVEVMEVNRRNLENIGLRYPTQASLGVRGEDDVPGQLSITELKQFNSDLGVFKVSDPLLALNLLHKDTDTNLLANPKIRVKNRDTAKIHVGDRVPVLTSVSNSTGFVSQSISYIEVGIKLEVEPTILIQDQVSIQVKLEVSNIVDQITSSSGVVAYTIGSRNADTTLQLKDGETQILAGLFKDDEQNTTYKVPGLSSLPLIGRFFTDEGKDTQKNEIVLLITPRILHNIVPANAVYTTFPSGIEHAERTLPGQPMRPLPAAGAYSMAPPE
ncbi:MAG TPA: type II and III secretion system protein, partial [Methylophaga aminisulfidivorans]|nr:type II and III secretion system protein [Methylophaga aminisulfidivorans]